MTTVVYPYLEKFAKWQELRYSLRSLEKHLKGDFRVLIVGDKPDWIQGVEHIEMKRDPRKSMTNHFDVANKVITAAESEKVGARFIRMYDDIYLLKDVEQRKIGLLDGKHVATQRPKYNGYDGRNWKQYVHTATLKQHKKLLFLTYVKLQKDFEYNRPEFYNFETHSPKLFDTDLFLKSQSRWMFRENRLLVNSLYFNFWFQEEKPEIIEKKEGFMVVLHGETNMFSDVATEENIDNLLGNNAYLNHNNRGLNDVVKKAIEERFPDKSSFEV